jgi:WD40 repeat protein
MQRILLIFFSCLFTVSLQAQNFDALWTDHFSYVSIQDISQGNDRLFVAAENAIFIYDLSTQEIVTISSVQGLSGESISSIYYSEPTDLLLIGYENGLIEVVNIGQENDVLIVVDILNKQTIPPNKKKINHFTEHEGKVYISAQFGVSVYDLERLEFGDSYFIGDGGSQIDITQTTIADPYIYASSSEGGIRRAILDNEDIIDFQEWETLTGGNYIGIQLLGTRVLTARSDNSIFRINAGNVFEPLENYAANIVGFGVNNGLLTVTTTNAIRSYEQGFLLRAAVTSLPEYDYVLQSGYSFNDVFYMGTTLNGLLQVPFGTTQASQVLPDGPLLNKSFSLDASAGSLWVSYGEIDVFFNPQALDRRGISNLKDNAWLNIPHDEITSSLGVDRVSDLVNVTIDQANPDTVYFSSFFDGILKVEDQVPTTLFNENNSILENPIFNNNFAGVRIYGSDFDRQGNLWAVQSLTDDALIKLAPNGQIQTIDVTSVSGGREELAHSEVAVSREGFVFFSPVETGLAGYNPNNGQFNVIGEGDGQGGLPSTDIRALAFDSQNRLWIGTLRGLRVLFSPGSFFSDGQAPEAQSIIFLDGEGVGQELLFEQPITDIEVDGSNNKWIATATSGVFYISANGQETLLRFTKDNSPLPSNSIQDIAIDPFTGEVYFATVNGLVSFNGNATAPRDTLEEVFVFPNPVRPQFEGNVTIDGLTANANVKITDLEGNLVFQQTSEGGSVQWDTTVFGRYRVASGVYFVLITSEDALETKIKKIMVIR